MKEQSSDRIGFACAYTPLALIDAAGFMPFRVLPLSDASDQAGHLLHDNLCPHVKRILDRAMENDLPDLAGMVFVNSCDAMRRLADAWKQVRKGDKIILIDLPTTLSDSAILFLAGEFARFSKALSGWGGRRVNPAHLERSLKRYNKLAGILQMLKTRIQKGTLEGGGARMQTLYNRASTEPIDWILDEFEQLLRTSATDPSAHDSVPIYLFGNLFADPEAFSLLESCGARIVGDDLCSGSRLFVQIDAAGDGDIFSRLASGMFARPRCARTFDPSAPLAIAEDIRTRVKTIKAGGVIGHTLKFCDPYMDRLPVIREELKKADIPLLLLEGDCTMRSMGQQRTRIEAFIEMLR